MLDGKVSPGTLPRPLGAASGLDAGKGRLQLLRLRLNRLLSGRRLRRLLVTRPARGHSAWRGDARGRLALLDLVGDEREAVGDAAVVVGDAVVQWLACDT